MRNFLRIFVLLLTFSGLESNARLQQLGEASYVFNSVSDVYSVKKDGQFERITEFEVEIKNESGRNDFGVYRRHYNKAISTLTILKAETRNANETLPVTDKMIEDKPLASRQAGFDDTNQVTVAFPKVEVGSRLYVKAIYKTKEVPIKNHFWTSHDFGWGAHLLKANLQVNSELPLYTEVDYPDDLLEIAKGENEGKYFLNISLKKPYGFVPTEENNPLVPARKIPRIQVASSKTWSKELLANVLKENELILNQELSGPLLSAIEEAKKESDFVTQVELIMASIQNQIRYLGDWRTIKGAFIPRELPVILKSGIGDCKDYSALLTKALRSLGYKANIAWVYRDADSIRLPSMLPILSNTNHAITFVEKDGKNYFFDPTNHISYGQATFQDIADREALILDSEKPHLERIPKVDPASNVVKIDLTVDLKDSTTSDVEGSIKYSGISASEFTGAGLRESKIAVERKILDWVAFNRDQVTSYEFEPFDLSSRMVRDLSFNFKFKELTSLSMTSSGPGYFLFGSSPIYALINQTPKRETDLYLNFPRILERRLHLTSLRKLGTASMNCHIETPWVTADRKVASVKDGVIVTDTISVKSSHILVEEFQDPSFLEKKQAFQKCFQHTVLVFQRTGEMKIVRSK